MREDPRSARARAALAAISLELFDGDTAEREARQAMDRGFDPAAGTALLLRAYVIQGRHRELLRDFPAPEASAPPAVAGQVAAARTLSHLALDQRDEARRSVAEALRLAPGAVEAQIAAAALAEAEGDRAAAEAAIARALAIDAAHPLALLRKAGLQASGGNPRAAVETLGSLIARQPGQVQARLGRAAAYLQLSDDAAARQDVEAALRTVPNSVQGNYLRAALLVRAREWRVADETLQRIDPMLSNFPDGFLLRAMVKSALGDVAQAEDAARRHYARRPEDPRGAKLLAVLELQAGRPDGAAGTLARLDQRGAADAEALDLLGRAHVAAGRPREAAAALQRAAALAPNDAGIQSRLAAARLAVGDVAGSAQAGQQALRIDPTRAGAHETLAAGALARGDLAAAEAELAALPEAARQSPTARTLEATIRLIRLDLDGARERFEAVLRDDPNSVPARLGLARVALARDDAAGATRLLGEVLRHAPGNAEAIARLASAALAGNVPARAALEAAQSAAPGEPALAIALAGVLSRTGDAPRAVTVLDAEALRGRGRGVALPIARVEAHAAANQWPEAEAAARAALAEDPASVQARRLLAVIQQRGGDARGAEATLRDGLRLTPGDEGLQQGLLALVLQARGLDAALELADELARQSASRPASLTGRGELLRGARRFEEAARAFAASLAEAPSSRLALRTASAWAAAGRAAEAVSVLDAWLAREPNDPSALGLRAQFDIQAGRLAEAERRLNEVVTRAPNDPVALNNLAWLLATREGGDAARAKALAERAYFLAPSTQTADTLGWTLARHGEPARAVPLLRQAVSVARPGQAGPDPGMVYRLAFALRAAGQPEEALRVLEPVLAGDAAFAERGEAERLRDALRGGTR